MSYCVDCGEDFREDDCGGYNPPCSCGAHCRSCHEAEMREELEWENATDTDVADAWQDFERPSSAGPDV